MKTTTNLRTSSNYHNTDSVLELLNTPEHHARVKKARRKQAFHYWKTRLIIDAFLIALGFVLGIVLI